MFGLEWNPYELSHQAPCQFATFGRRHARIWGADKGLWSPTVLTFGKFTQQDVHAAQWLPPKGGTTECVIAFGMADGQIYLYK